DGYRPPLEHLCADPGAGRAGRDREPGGGRLESLSGGVTPRTARDLRASRRAAGRRAAPPDVADEDQPPDARPLLRPRRARPASRTDDLESRLQVRGRLGG